LETNNTHTITGNALKLKFGRHCSVEHIIALNRLSATLNTDSTTVTTQDIAQVVQITQTGECQNRHRVLQLMKGP